MSGLRPGPAALALVAALLQGCLATGASQRPAVVETLQRADTAFAQGELGEAQAAYQRAIEGSPGLVSPHFQLGLIAYQRGETGRASAHFDAVLERDPGHVLATYNLAMVHLQRARALLERHRRLAPVSAGRPPLIALRRAIEALSERTPADP